MTKEAVSSGIVVYTLEGPKESFTNFTTNHGRIASIQVAAHHGG